MEGVAEAPVGTNRRRLEGVLSRLAAEGQEPPVAQPQQEQQLAPARFEFSQL